jgi:hypothetical protein
MITKEDYEYLKSLPHLSGVYGILDLKNAWYASDETLVAVARILNNNGVFPDSDIIIDFFESPHKWVRDIWGLIKEYEYEKEAQPCPMETVPLQVSCHSTECDAR